MRQRLVTCRPQAESWHEFRAFLLGAVQSRPSLPWQKAHYRMSVRSAAQKFQGLAFSWNSVTPALEFWTAALISRSAGPQGEDCILLCMVAVYRSRRLGVPEDWNPMWDAQISHLIRPYLLTRCGHVNGISQARPFWKNVEPYKVKSLCTLWRLIEGVGVGCSSTHS
jgi:hypothetical protein